VIRRAAAAALGLAGLLAAAAGCGGSPPAAVPAAPTPAHVDPEHGLTQQQAQRALLAAGDLPLGFQPSDGSGEATALGCAGIDGAYLAHGVAARASASFGHASSPAFVNETITTRPGEADAALAGFARAPRECGSFTTGGVAYAVSTLSLPGYGDGSAAVRVTSDLKESRPVDLVAVRLGDTIVAVAAAGGGREDAELTRTVVERALAKIARLR
jgi:hypothetical protein